MTRLVALRILALAGGIGIVAQAFLVDTLLGVNVPLLTGGVLAAACLVRPSGRRLDPLDAWLPVAAIALSVAFAVRADPVLLGLDLLALAALVAASVAAIGGEAVMRRSAIRVVELGLLVMGWTGVGVIRVASLAGQRPEGSPSAAERVPAWAAPVARGLLIAAPVLIVFAALFSSADAAFDALITGLFTWDVDLGMLPVRIAVAFVIAWGVAGLLSVAGGAIADSEARDRARVVIEPRPQSLGAAAAGLPASGSSAGEVVLPVRLGAIEATTILAAVDVLFGVFVLVQLRYLFGGHADLEVSGLPYAAYARSGFFELVWVAFLAGGLVATVHALATRRTVALVASGVVLAGLTGAILVSALVRLRIYQDAYGWTELRFYVLASIVWLAIGIGLTIVLLVRDRMGWLLHGLAAAAVVVLIGINVVGPSRLIAAENVARVLDPTLVPRDGKSGIDTAYVRGLGDDAIPALVRVLPALPAADARQLSAWLLDRRRELVRPEARAWPAWNLGRTQAVDALRTLP